MDEIPEAERVRIATDFIKAAPPGELKEVVNDVRVLLGNDQVLGKASRVFYDYATEQFTAVNVDGADTLVTKTGSLDGSRKFLDPTQSKSFTYNFLKNEVSEVATVERDARVEPWREAMATSLKKYMDEFYPDHVSAVYGKMEGDKVSLTLCIEDHKYNPNNFWNGKWRSSWTVEFPTAGGNSKVAGKMHVQVHYYEDGNVQLMSDKTAEENVLITSNQAESAAKVVEFIKKAETKFQLALNENYTAMSNTTFKALRRNLPITHNLIDWHKLHGFQVGKEIMGKNS